MPPDVRDGPVQRARACLLAIDPDGSRALQATKTVAGVAAILLVLRGAPGEMRLFAGLAVATLLQCTGAGDARYQRRCMLASGIVMAALVAVGGGLDGMRWAKDVLLVAVAYATFEVRRLLPDHPTFPTFCFTLCVLSTMLPGDLAQSARAAGSVAVGLAIAYPLYFVVAPRLSYPKPGPEPGRRAALRAATAAFLAIAVAEVFRFERAYWAILVAVLVTSDTLRSHVERAGERLGATVAGCALGALLHLALRPLPNAEILVMLGAIFLAVFFRQVSYRWTSFFATLYVVFLFASTGQWTTQILVARIYETAIGGAVSLLAGLFIQDPPPSAPRSREESA